MSQDQFIRDLAAAVSLQSKVANRLWLTLMTVVVFSLLQMAAPQQQTQVSLPLNLGAIPMGILYPVLFAILIILTVAFSSAHAQQVRARKYANRYINLLPTTEKEPHPRELFDMLCQPSIARVAPLAQTLRGDYQFFETIKDCPAWRWHTSTVYYAILKASAIGIYFLLPGWALLSVGLQLWRKDIVPVPLLTLAPIGLIPLLQVTVSEVVDAWGILRTVKRPSRHVA